MQITNDSSLIVGALTPSNGVDVTLVGRGASIFCEIYAVSGRLTDLRALGPFTRMLGNVVLVKLLCYLEGGIQKRNVEECERDAMEIVERGSTWDIICMFNSNTWNRA